MRKLFLFIIVAVLTHYSNSHATINVIVTTSEGLVLAADSRITITDTEEKLDSSVTTDAFGTVTKVYKYKEKLRSKIASDYSQKIFQIGTSVGVASSGAAFLYNEAGVYSSIKGLIEDFRAQAKIQDDKFLPVDLAARKLKLFFEKLYESIPQNKKKKRLLRLMICGYDSKNKRKVFEFLMPADTIRKIFGPKSIGSVVKGQTDAFSRLIKGYEPSLINSEIYSENKELFHKLRYDIRYALMSLQDAIDFATFIVRTTIETQRFNQEATMGVGGDIDIAIITLDGFRWIKKKELHGN